MFLIKILYYSYPLVSSNHYIESPIRKKTKLSLKQTTIGFHLYEDNDKLIENTLPRREKQGSTTSNKKERREKTEEQKQRILSTWIMAGLEEERLELVRMQEMNSKRSEFESEIEKVVHGSDEHNPPPVIQCVKGIVRSEKSWNERTQRIYFYLHPELANKKCVIRNARWAYPSLLEKYI